MLTVTAIKDAEKAAEYYKEVDGYFFREAAPTQWNGNGAQNLGLTGEVDAVQFERLLRGEMPDGSQILRAGRDANCAHDLTFSASKSISVQAYIGGDQRLITAHDNAVTKTLRFYESELAAYRETVDGVTSTHQSGNILVARIRHDVSRAVDPQLHTHAVMINATQKEDGTWRALSHSTLFEHQRLLGVAYRNELALEAQKLGYAIRRTHADGRFELDHFSSEQLKVFSQRAAQIETALADRGHTLATASPLQKEIATLSTRDSKSMLDRNVVHKDWQTRAQTVGLDFALGSVRVPSTEHQIAESTKEAVTYAIEHAMERDSIAGESSLLRFSLEHRVGGTSIEAIRDELTARTQSGELIHVRSRYTTERAQNMERELLAIEVRGRQAVDPMYQTARAKQLLRCDTLNDGQRAAALMITTTKHQVVGIQGIAGSGKTTLLRAVNKSCNVAGWNVVGIAPSAAAARELRGAGIKSETIAAFRNRASDGLNKRTLLVVDESSMASRRDLHYIIQRIEVSGAHVVLVGDTRQLKAIQAGRPFDQLQKNGMLIANVGEVVRQRNASLKTAVELAGGGQVVESVKQLDKSIVEVPYKSERYAQIAHAYSSLSSELRQKTLVVAGTNSARSAINTVIRKDLELAGKGIQVDALINKGLTAAQVRTSLSYQPGDQVEAQRNYPSLGLNRGDFATVVDVNEGRVILANANGEQANWQPALASNFIAYSVEHREIATGDLLRLTANNHAVGIVNGDLATVCHIDEHQHLVTVERLGGDKFSLDTSEPLHIEHGYCSTVHSAQGKTTDHVLIEADTNSLTANESLFYVAVSRARDSATIFTDDRDALPDAMSQKDEKSAALDLSAAGKGFDYIAL